MTEDKQTIATKEHDTCITYPILHFAIYITYWKNLTDSNFTGAQGSFIDFVSILCNIMSVVGIDVGHILERCDSGDT